jgi:hypothetical protein
MFKKKAKKSHKSDEIYVDYSKEVDIKKTEKDEAKKEHYAALDIKDEVVVSTSQITQAKNQAKQDERIQEQLKQATKTKDLEEKQHEEERHEEETPLVEADKNLDTDKFIEQDEKKEDHTDEHAKQIESTLETKQKEPFIQEEDSDPFIETSEESVDEDIESFEEDLQEPSSSSTIPSFLRQETRQTRTIKRPQEEFQDNEVTPIEKNEEPKQEETQLEVRLEDALKSNHRDVEEKQVRKQDLHSYFQVDGSVLKKGLRRKKTKTKEETGNQQTPKYQIKHHSFYSMDEFVAYLDEHYERIDEIASAILKDEQFFRWLKEESIYFEESILKMKKIKQELKQ